MEEKESKYNIFRTDSGVGTDGSKPVELILPKESHFLKQSYLNAVRGLLYLGVHYLILLKLVSYPFIQSIHGNRFVN